MHEGTLLPVYSNSDKKGLFTQNSNTALNVITQATAMPFVMCSY
jgi:hypothetical protein